MHRVNQARTASLLALSLLASGCSMQQGDFPSLAKRPYETKDPVTAPASEAAMLTTSLPDSLRSQLGALVARHEMAETAFQGALPATRRAAQLAAGSAMGSESWVSAQMEVSRLDKKRADSLAALAEIDRLVTVERDKGADAGLVGLMAPAQDKVQREVDAQTAAIVELTRLIG